MSGDEADESSIGDSSSEEEDTPLPVSPFKSGTDEPFKVVFKGGRPWGFELTGGTEIKAPLQISKIESESKAAGEGKLQVGDYIISINDVSCTSKVEAEQLIQSAFRTLTLTVWRGTSEPVKSPVQSSSFLLKARELQERARQQAAAQDDSAVYSESKSATAFRMKPRQRRIESFHGGRRGSAQSTSSLSSSASATKPPQRGLSPRCEPPTASSENSGLKGWATENDLTAGHQPIIMSSRHGPLSPSKSTPSLNQDEILPMSLPSRGFTPSSHQAVSMTKSSPDVSEQVNYENLSSPLSPKSPSWYQQRFPNRSVFDFSSSAVRRSQGSPRNSYAGYSPSYSQFSNFPISSAHSYMPSSNTGVFSATYIEPPAHLATSQSHISSGSSVSSYDDTPHREQKKNYDRRSLPPQTLYNFRQDVQKENIKPEQQNQKHLKSMPTTKEENESDSEMPSVTPRPSNNPDLRPMYSPPAPPIRDISSLKYVGFSQNHEKYPSWPVTTANPPTNLSALPVNVAVRDKTEKVDSENSQEKTFEAHMSQLSDKSSPGSDRKGNEETKQSRNQSDPGFKQKPKQSFYTTRKPKFEATKERDYENLKSEEERFNDFCNQSKPGYPPPKFDPDGHNYGDEKYNIPSPPERDVPNSDERFEKSLVEKINSVINPTGMQYHSFQYQHHYSPNTEGFIQKSHKIDMATSPLQNSSMSKIPGMYFQQAMNSQNLLHLPNASKNMVDSGTSPISSPKEEKDKPGFRTITANPRNDSFQVPVTEKSRGLIIRQMPYYNTSTQTDDANYQSKPYRNSADLKDNSKVMEKSVQAFMSHNSSLNSDSDATTRTQSTDREKYLRKDYLSDSHLNQPLSLSSLTAKSETSSQSSGIGSMNFSDQSSAPMLRKLSEEFYRGKLGVSVSNEKRMSAVHYDDLKSPRSESVYSGGLKEAESLSSVVIHPHETAGPFGHDDFGSSPSLTSTQKDFSDFEHDHFGDPRHNMFQKARHSIDAASILHKASASMSLMTPRSLQDSRFTSENNLMSHNSRNYSQSMVQLSKPATLSEGSQRNSSTISSDSGSQSSRPRGSMEARSSESRISTDSSTAGAIGDRSSVGNRRDSDSVFFDRTSPAPAETKKTNPDDKKDDDKQNAGLGRKVSMKMAYGTFDENEHHYATPYAHQRNNSENLSPQGKEAVAHGRSQSYTDYMPMHFSLSPVDMVKLGQIQEEESEVRWQEAVRKSKSLSRDTSNYMNIETNDVNKSEKKNAKSKTGMKRTVSEQIRPRKNEAKKSNKQILVTDCANKEQNSNTELTKGNKSDSETTTMSQHFSDSDLKKVQQKAVLDFVERKTRPRSSDDSEPQSPSMENPPSSFQGTAITPTTPSSPSPIIMDITKRYNYSKAQRVESLRKNRSSSSCDSSADYVDMKRPDRNYQTEWSRLRSQDGALPRRPLSIGSDVSGTDSFSAKAEEEASHVRSVSETITTQIQDGSTPQMEAGKQQPVARETSPSAAVNKDDTMVTSPVYQNLGEYPRRPPPPVPGLNSEDQPPALPPRSYQARFKSSKSESFLFAQLDPTKAEEIRDAAQKEFVGHKKWENSPREDAYAEQLRKQARRYSEQQHKPMSMQVLSTKSPIQVSLSQSFKQEPVQPSEAKPLQKFPSPSTKSDIDSVLEGHSPGQKMETASLELPPMPTPLKNGEVEMKVDLNETADFPPPPAEFAEESATHITDGCADDSYGSYKTRTSRELGKYKRTVSDSNVLRAHTENKLKTFPELNSSDVSEMPSKPPRKKLELQGRDSPIEGQDLPGAGPGIPTFQAVDLRPLGAQKQSAQPLETKQSSQMASNGGSFISTVVQRPSANVNADRTGTQQDEHLSVKDRIKNIEVISHSPGSAKSGQKSNSSRVEGIKASFQHDMESGTAGRGTDSLEKLESSVRSSNSFKDRLRPVVRKVENVPKNENVPPLIAKSDPAKVEGTPPVPVRTYKTVDSQGSSERPPRPSSKPGEVSQTPRRQNSFQFRNSASSHPRPYENRTDPSVTIHSPVWAKGENVHNEPLRKGGPEPQVPSRVPLRPKVADQARDQLYGQNVDQNQISSSRNQRPPSESAKSDTSFISSVRSPGSSRNYESPSSQSYSVQVGQKRKSDNSFSSRAQGANSFSPNVNTESSYSPESQARHSDNVHYNRYQNNAQVYSQRGDKKGKNQRPESDDSAANRFPAQPVSRYQSGDYKHWRTQNEKDRVEKSPESQTNSVSKKLDDSSQAKEDEQNKENIENKQKTTCDKTVDNKTVVIVSHQRVPSTEELECDEKAHELARVLQDSDKQLSQVLTQDSNKSRMQYMDGLFTTENEPVPLRPRSASKSKEDSASEEKEKADEDEPTSPMPSNYYVSPPKAMIELEIRKFGDTSPLTQGIGDNDSLAEKKEELLQRMVKKLDILKDDKKELLLEIHDNEKLGKQVADIVEQKCRSQQEKEKFRSYIEDMDKIIRLLLKLSGLLARAENTIQGLTENTNEKIKKMTYDKRDRLHQQHEDAKELKLDIDRRREHVEGILKECLSASELDDYHYFIKMKSKYTIQMQELEDKITLGNEQITALQKSIPNKNK